MTIDERHVLRTTPRGDDELGGRTHALSPRHRRCLELVAKRATLRDLATSFRPGELGPILRELVEQGYVEMPAGGPAAVEASAAKITFIDEARFAQIQDRAMRELAQRLGAAGEPIARQIAACARPEQLRIALRSIEKSLAGPLGAEVAKEFVKRVGQELMGG